MPSITRRRLLVWGSALSAGVYGVFRLDQRLDRGRPDANLNTWNPDAGTWPLPRYDPANTAHNPNANPPREEPTRHKLASFSTDDDTPHFRPLVGSEHIVLYGSELVVVPRDGGNAARVGDSYTFQAGFGPDGRLHAVRSRPTERSTVIGYTGDELTKTYQTTIDVELPQGIVVGTREVYVGTLDRGTFAIDPVAGGGWRVEGRMPALASGRLYTAGPTLVAYEEQDGLDRVLEAGPRRMWSAKLPRGEANLPAVADGRVVVGTRRDGFKDLNGTVTAYDAATGNQLWSRRDFGVAAATPAVVGDRGYTAVRKKNSLGGLVAALDLATGDTIWQDEVGWDTFSPVVAGDTLVVAGKVREDKQTTSGRVRAYDTASGEALWTVMFEPTEDLGGLALVDDRVFLTAGMSLYELTLT